MTQRTPRLAVFLVVVLSLPSAAYGHDPYSGIHNFDNENCCDGDDCRRALPAEVVRHEKNGISIYLPTGEIVTPGKRAYSPDNNYHICRTDGGKGKIKCLMLPPDGV